MTTPSLFVATPEERSAALDRQIETLLSGRSGGPFGLTLPAPERLILQRVRYHRGAKNPIGLKELARRAHMSDREVKDAVRTLRLSFHVPIGASKSSTDGGYFLILTPEDLRLYLASPLQQIRAELEVVRAVGGARAVHELLGQLTLTFTPEASL